MMLAQDCNPRTQDSRLENLKPPELHIKTQPCFKNQNKAKHRKRKAQDYLLNYCETEMKHCTLNFFSETAQALELKDTMKYRFSLPESRI